MSILAHAAQHQVGTSTMCLASAAATERIVAVSDADGTMTG